MLQSMHTSKMLIFHLRYVSPAALHAYYIQTSDGGKHTGNEAVICAHRQRGFAAANKHPILLQAKRGWAGLATSPG